VLAQHGDQVIATVALKAPGVIRSEPGT
jgi:hypothetical protein